MEFENESLDNNLLGITPEEQYSYTEGDINYNHFICNNWRVHNDTTRLIYQIYLAGGAIWMNTDGCLCFRMQPGEEITQVEQVSKMERLITTFLKLSTSVKFFKYTKDNAPDLSYDELRVVKEKFTPFSNSEFYYENGVWCRTAFVPSELLKRPVIKTNVSFDDMPNIDILLNNLVDNKPERLQWILNWLAGFFQTLKRSRVSLVLRGDQGSGKGIFFNEIISALFGEKYTAVVSDDSLESDFKSWVSEKLFYNLNEIAVDMKSRRNTKNFLKQLVTDEYVYVQSKFKDFKETKLYGNILITSNEAFPIEVEVSDRRFTIFQTGRSLKSLDIDTSYLILGIREEIGDFADFLKNYQVDWELYHTALDTPEKQAIVDGTTSSIKRFIYAIINHDLDYFEELNGDDDVAVFNELKSAFHEGRISRTTLYAAYEKMYDNKKTAKKFTLEVRNLEPAVFGKNKQKRTGNVIYYNI